MLFSPPLGRLRSEGWQDPADDDDPGDLFVGAGHVPWMPGGSNE